MQFRSGFWPNYDPVALTVLIVGIVAVATLALSF